MDTHGHQHSHGASGSKALKISLAIVLVVMVAEIAGGIISGSLALIGDAGHMLVDALALSLSLFAITIARRPASASRTYGYHRIEIMAALANGVILIVVAGYIFYEAYQRFTDPHEVQAPLMLIVAVVGLVANIAGLLLLKKASHSSLNVKAAFWHIIGDTISSVGVIIAGIIILIMGSTIADPIIAVIIGIIILWGAVRIVREAAEILMESVPKHIDVDKVVEAIKEVDGVDGVGDIHVWTITSGIYALSAHLLIQDTMVSHAAEILEKVNQALEHDYHITHTTLQLECEKCDACADGVICNLSRTEEGHRH
ncbi:cation diffusion facilitator family transporter [Chloroflexota bacterium]